MKFEDCEGRPWDLTITVGKAAALIENHELDFIEGDVNQNVTRVLESPRLRLDMAWTLIKDQAKEQDIEEMDFLNAIGPNEIMAINNGLKESIVNFIVAQRPESASSVENTISNYGLLMKKQAEMQVAIMSNPAIEKKIEEQMEKVKAGLLEELGKLSIDLPELAAGKPADAPSGS